MKGSAAVGLEDEEVLAVAAAAEGTRDSEVPKGSKKEAVAAEAIGSADVDGGCTGFDANDAEEADDSDG